MRQSEFDHCHYLDCLLLEKVCLCVIFVVNFLSVFVLMSYKRDPVLTKFYLVLCGFACVCMPYIHYGK